MASFLRILVIITPHFKVLYICLCVPRWSLELENVSLFIDWHSIEKHAPWEVVLYYKPCILTLNFQYSLSFFFYRTDLFFHVVEPETNRILSADEAKRYASYNSISKYIAYHNVVWTSIRRHDFSSVLVWCSIAFGCIYCLRFLENSADPPNLWHPLLAVIFKIERKLWDNFKNLI